MYRSVFIDIFPSLIENRNKDIQKNQRHHRHVNTQYYYGKYILNKIIYFEVNVIMTSPFNVTSSLFHRDVINLHNQSIFRHFRLKVYFCKPRDRAQFRRIHRKKVLQIN